jgi:predicted short-subunit dehydrogenase-like oxidoreductase (DUF2520 family)
MLIPGGRYRNLGRTSKQISPSTADRYLRMWELERNPQSSPSQDLALPSRVAVVGSGRVGNVLARGLRGAGVSVEGPLGRGADPADVDVVLLCVPDAEIAAAAVRIPDGALVGHCSGATTLDVLAPHEAFSLHPLMTFTARDDPTRLHGAGAAVAGSTPRALAAAEALARALGLRPVQIADDDRATYHAAASIASNFLVTLEAAAERLLATAGADRELLVPLVRATVENWAKLGPARALTGPVARGDEATVVRQRTAVAARIPTLLPLFDTMVEATRDPAGAEVASA